MLQEEFLRTKKKERKALRKDKNIIAEINNSVVGLEAKIDRISKKVEHRDKGREDGREK